MLSISENNQRRSTSTGDSLRTIRRLYNSMEGTEKEKIKCVLGAKIFKTKQPNTYLALKDLPEVLVDLMDIGELTIAVAIELAKLSSEKQIQVFENVKHIKSSERSEAIKKYASGKVAIDELKEYGA